jgi:hypothetical protein
MNTVKKRKLEYLGHIIRNGTKWKLCKSIFLGKELGRGEDPEEEGYYGSSN